LNDYLILRASQELAKFPYEIKDIFLLVNCHSTEIVEGGHIVGASLILSVRDSFHLSSEEKMILMAEMAKRLELTSEDVAVFLQNIVSQPQGWI